MLSLVRIKLGYLGALFSWSYGLTFSHFGPIPVCDGQTDGRTDP